MTDLPDLSLILPCYNEEGILEESLREILETLDREGIRHEIIFVDDASRDGTREAIDDLLRDHPRRQFRVVLHETNRGRGACVTEGIRLAKAEVAGFIDIDLETHCRHIPEALRRLRDGADVAVARRMPRVGIGNLHRHVLSRGYRLLVRWLLGLPYEDTESGFKFFRRRSIAPVLDRIQAKGWFWDTEVMAYSHRGGLEVAEIPCPFVRRADHPSTVRPVRDSIEYFRSLLRLRHRLRREEVSPLPRQEGRSGPAPRTAWARPGPPESRAVR